MKKKLNLCKKVMSFFLVFVLVISCLPVFAVETTGSGSSSFHRVVDTNTMNGWTKYFDLNNLDTSNAGGIWTDKSVFTNADEFPSGITMIDDEKNFLTALSALAANKEIVGYSTIPTDTVLVLDVSGSMDGNEGDLVKAANDAITRLLEINSNNRIGVVLYSASGTTGSSTYEQSVTRLLPIGRYTTTNDTYIVASNNKVSVSNNVCIEGQSGDPQLDNSKNVSGGTYIQAGLWEAMKMFEEMDTVISDNNWQTGDNRMPILVLMSDGAPTTGTSYYDDVENSQYTSGRNTVYGSNVGNGSESNMTTGQGFLVQLTASYVKNKIENHYKSADGTAKSLFYTFGFNLSDSNNIALSVLDPERTTITDSLWNSYNNITNGTLSVNVKNRNGNNSDVAIRKNSYVTDKHYVDEYFSASGNNLTTVFAEIVNEIIIQSRYYPTYLAGGNPDFAGYVEFTDILGDYMEVKEFKGLLLGNTLFNGSMMASKLFDTSDDGLGTPEKPTKLGEEFIKAVKNRLDISQHADAQSLITSAIEAGQLKYNSASDWSNYIGWYAKADGTFIGFWNDNLTETAPAGAVYKMKSYCFLGETFGSIKNSDMMYMSVDVQTDIATGRQIVLWQIPAALVPMITYLVTLKGTHAGNAQDVEVSIDNVDNATPIRLVYETGLRSDFNEFNINSVTDPKHIAADGNTRIFWNNFFDISASTHDEHITTIAEFTPNKENERFYFTFDSAVHKKVGDSFVLVGQNETLDENGEYYHRRYIFKETSTEPLFLYEKMSSASIMVAKNNGWKENFETLDGTFGAWVVPSGTPARELQMYDEQKSVNVTQSAFMIFHPYITEENNTFYVDMNLGNNGLLSVAPATGIKITKTIDIYEAGTLDTFKFRVNANLTGTYDAFITAIGETPSGDATKITFNNGSYEFELKKDQTLWLSGIPASTAYTVEEISDNSDYKVKSVHVNGVSTGKTANGVVTQHLIDDIKFVNTAIGIGDLIITKRVEDENGNVVNINDDVKFTAKVKLSDRRGRPVSGQYNTSVGIRSFDSNGEMTITLTEGESFVIRGISEQTDYTVTEINVPDGFEFNSVKSSMSGTIDLAENNTALIVNTYVPTSTNGKDVGVHIVKSISGNRTEWVQGESYTFKLELLSDVNLSGTVIATKTISYNDDNKFVLFDLSSENYTKPGIYYYKLTEVDGNQGGISYDVAERRFSVVVADDNMNGDLKITSVNNVLNTSISGKWTVSADFNNIYEPKGSATATINICKKINGGYSLGGYQFALYDANPLLYEANEITRSNFTDANGNASISISYAANRATESGAIYTYYLSEINAGKTIGNIKYTDMVYKVEVIVKDNLDGTISAISKVEGDTVVDVATFTNEYVPSSSDFVTISGHKTTTDNRVINAGEFEFELIPDLSHNAKTPVPANTTVKNSADGSFKFDAIEFKDEHKGKTYKYYVSEVQDNKIGGFTYDQTVYVITVTVTDNGNQTITATAIINNGSNNVSEITFHNVYDPRDVMVEVKGNKVLVGKTMQSDEFEFEIKPVTQLAPSFTNLTVKNDANGNFSFGNVTFDRAGIYVYEVTEKAGTDARYVYDNSVYTVTVTVRDDSQGVLSANIAIEKNGLSASGVVFSNVFVPESISYDIHANFQGNKVLVGRELKDGEFEFVLQNAVSGEQIGNSVKNDDNGTFRFENVALSKADTYNFKIVEKVGNSKGVSYDNTAYYIQIVVVQNEFGVLLIETETLYKSVIETVDVEGVLTQNVRYDDVTDIGKISFTNVYKAVATEMIIEAVKTYKGAELNGEDFEFILSKDGVEIETVKNDAEGKVKFAAISVTDEGEYIFTVSEVKGDREEVTYDESVYTVKVTVVDNKDGTFKVAYVYEKDDIEVENIEFVNNFTEPEPDFESPKTGESNNVWLLFALMFVSGGCFIASVIAIKKDKVKVDK